jgi:hypothetical protein
VEGRADLGSVHELALFDVQHDCRQAVINHGAFAAATDHWLDATSSVTHMRQFLLGHEVLMQQLSFLEGWEQRRRWMYNRKIAEPRLTHSTKTSPPPRRFSPKSLPCSVIIATCPMTGSG